MMRIEKFDVCGNDSTEDACGARSVAVLVGDGFRVSLCQECLDSLTESSAVVDKEIKRACMHCRNFQQHEFGLEYDGRCALSGKCTGPRFDTCDRFEEANNG